MRCRKVGALKIVVKLKKLGRLETKTSKNVTRAKVAGDSHETLLCLLPALLGGSKKVIYGSLAGHENLRTFRASRLLARGLFHG